MIGLHSHTKEQIRSSIEKLFDRSALMLVGPIPKLQKKMPYLVGFTAMIGLANLFVESMNNKPLNSIEEAVLKGLLEGANNYVDVLKEKTVNDVVQKIEGVARQAQMSGERIPQEEIQKILSEEFSKAKSHLEKIAAAETTKVRNIGATMDITRASALEGETDPVVGFAVTNGSKACDCCKKIHLMEDGVTPRLYKLSEVSAGYYKKGDKYPSLAGLHPNCFCSLFRVPKDWGFDGNGHMVFVGIGHDELANQRE